MAATLIESTNSLLRFNSILPERLSASESESCASEGSSSKHLRPASPGKRLPHPVVFKMLARRRLSAQGKRQKTASPVASMLLARRYMKVMAARKASGLNASEAARRQEQQAAVQAELAWQRGTPLCFENVDRLYPDMRDEVLGNRLYRLIELTSAIHPGKVTGMILEGYSTREIYDMLHTGEVAITAATFLALVDEAHEVLSATAMEGKEREEREERLSDGGADAETASTTSEAASAAPTEQTTARVMDDEWRVVQAKRRRSPSHP